MNTDKLKQAEEAFLDRYPAGFMAPEMQELGKKHKMDQMIGYAQDSFGKNQFKNVHSVGDNMAKTVSRSSMISVFEKPKFRDMVKALPSNDLAKLTDGLKGFLHNKRQQRGFETMLEVLKEVKLAKWSLMTIIPNYYHPNDEVFVKPTTAKGVIAYFDIQDLVYKPTPTWAFYERYREIILEMRAAVSPALAPNNAAFSGFLMMSMGSK